MMNLPVRLRAGTKTRNISLEIDARRLEKLASVFGFFNPEFLASLDTAERDVRAGRVRKIRSLKDLEV